jgi:Putative Flp pilus-assembly TadE/G-like
MSSARLRQENGVVMVIVALWLPVMLIFISFAIDAAHFWDFSRNLQNRADAAALAAGAQYGNACFGSATQAQLDGIGHAAQQYSGPPGAAADLPYAYGSVSNYQNTLNNPGASTANFHLRLNASASADHGGVNFEMGNFCNATYDTPHGPAADVWVTQEHVPLFLPLLGFSPNISAHARVALQGEAGTAAAPIAVGDSGFTPCVSVRLMNATTNALIQTVTLTKVPPNPANPTAPVQWDNLAAPASFTMPASDNVYAQPFLNDCNGTGQTYDDSTNTGLLMINNHPATNPTVANGNPPQITTGGVTANGTCANGTQYFAPSGAACTVEVDATVTFAPNAVSGGSLTLIQHTWDNVAQAWITTANPMHLSQGQGANKCFNTTAYCTNVTIPDTSGIDQFSLNWKETAGSIGTTQCGTGNGQQPPPCTGQFNNGAILQQVFGGCNGCDQPDDSGPIVFASVNEVNGATVTTNTNSFAGGSTHNIAFILKLSGLNTAAPGSPPTVLRFATSTNHQTGLVDCGQGNSASNDSGVVYYGCGPGNPLFTNPPLNPLFVYTRTDGSGCSPAVDGNTTGWPNGNNQDCVKTTSGQRRLAIICPLVERIVGAPFGGNCTGQAQGTCPANNWSSTLGSANIPEGDPRAIEMIITSPADFAAAGTAPQYWLPIRKFATFYVTGWDSNVKPSCGNNEPYPVKGKQNSQNGSVWGHWINYLDSAGTPNGQPCVTGASPTNCVIALTR